MPIAIPSKYIYDLKNPKVKDNVIERIEVNAVEVVPNNKYGTTVYNKTVTSYDSQISPADNVQENVFSSGESISGGTKLLTVAYSSANYVNQKVWKNEIFVPVKQYDKFIKRIFNGENKETGESYIGCSVYGRIEKYDVSSEWRVLDKENITRNTLNLTRTNIGDNAITIFNFPTDIESNPQGFNLISEVNLGSYDNLKTATFEPKTIDGIDYYVTTLEVLAEITTLQFSGSAKKEFSTGANYTQIPVTMSGTCEKYIPTRIEFTFMGDTIGVELTNKTEYINGTTAKKVFSAEGNELMQTGNFYGSEITIDELLGTNDDVAYLLVHSNDDLGSISHLYYNGESATIMTHYEGTNQFELWATSGGAFYNAVGTTILCGADSELVSLKDITRRFELVRQQYANGKETATIRCAIGEYYDNMVSVTIGGELSSYDEYTWYELFVTDGGTLEIGSTWSFNGVLFEVTDYDSYDNYYIIRALRNKLLRYQGVSGYAFGELLISANDKNLPMTFNLYDRVVPFVYAYVGSVCKDVPMARYADGTAKVFQVLSVRILYDGATWQELELQEV